MMTEEIKVRPIFRALGLIILFLGIAAFLFEVISGRAETNQIIDLTSFGTLIFSVLGILLLLGVVILVGASCMLGVVPKTVVQHLPAPAIDALKLRNLTRPGN